MVASSSMMRIVGPCWKPASLVSSVCDAGRRDGMLWYKDSGKHSCGEFSMAVVQANGLLEDASEVEVGELGDGVFGTFVGVFDGHGGPEAATYVSENLFRHLKNLVTEQKGVSADVIRKAYAATEEGFINVVRKQWSIKPQLASVGTCCLVGVISKGVLYVANAGDSRAVIAKVRQDSKETIPSQLSTEHNASIESVREELHSLHPDDPNIAVLKHNVWRVKGIIQVSRSIGDAYLKSQEFNREPLLPRFRVPRPFTKSILIAEPSILTHKLCTEDQFVIFASDGLWEHLSNQEAVDIVQCSPRNGIAKRLVKAALKEAAKKREMRYSDLRKIERGVRRHFHDDITVIVLYFDHSLVSRSNYFCPKLSLRGAEVPT